MPVHLEFKSMNDLSPDSVAKQVPELDSMLEMRRALLALKGPLGNVPTFRKAIQNILNDTNPRDENEHEENDAFDDVHCEHSSRSSIGTFSFRFLGRCESEYYFRVTDF